MRGDLSRAELRLWLRLRGQQLQGLRFRNQHPIGHYILDFYCPVAKLAVEVDGSSHDLDDQVTHDFWRDKWMAEQGIVTLRVRDHEIWSDLEAVVDRIREVGQSRRP